MLVTESEPVLNSSVKMNSANLRVGKNTGGTYWNNIAKTLETHTNLRNLGILQFYISVQSLFVFIPLPLHSPGNPGPRKQNKVALMGLMQ